MILDTTDVCQNAWYKFHGIKRRNLYNYKSMFLNGDMRDVHGNNGFKKSRENTIALVATINKIVEENLDDSPHLT